MDSMLAFARGQASRHLPTMVFDWDEAARRIVKSGTFELTSMPFAMHTVGLNDGHDDARLSPAWHDQRAAKRTVKS